MSGFISDHSLPCSHLCRFTQRSSTSWGGTLRDETKRAAKETTAVKKNELACVGAVMFLVRLRRTKMQLSYHLMSRDYS